MGLMSSLGDVTRPRRSFALSWFNIQVFIEYISHFLPPTYIAMNWK